MSKLLRYFQGLFGRFKPITLATVNKDERTLNFSRFAEGDRLLVDGKRLTAPLQHGQRHDTPTGFINHSDIIGRAALRSIFKCNTSARHEISYPSLDEYVSLTPRKVTPVYASYASLIVSLLDIHAFPSTTSNAGQTGPVVEILESGTGHGSLTLHLARAISAANPSFPTTDFAQKKQYKNTRGAVIHSVELSPTFSAHAQKIVSQFRQGLYAPHIDFHISSVFDWLTSEKSSRPAAEVENGYLNYAILDMPGVHDQIPGVVQAMKHDALLAVFTPSITQIGECVRVIQEKRVPLTMEKVVEMGEGISNGRVWDVRLVKPRKKPHVQLTAVPTGDDASPVQEDGTALGNVQKDTNYVLYQEDAKGVQGIEQEDKPVFVCRPMVGRLTMGGGFVGLWRKIDRSKHGYEDREHLQSATTITGGAQARAGQKSKRPSRRTSQQPSLA